MEGKSEPKKLTRADLGTAGIKVGELATVLGVHRTTVSDLLSDKVGRPTPGAHAIVALWPHVDEATRKALLAGEHFTDGELAERRVRTRTNTEFSDWWKELNSECRTAGIPEAGFCDATAAFEMRKSPVEAVRLISIGHGGA